MPKWSQRCGRGPRAFEKKIAPRRNRDLLGIAKRQGADLDRCRRMQRAKSCCSSIRAELGIAGNYRDNLLEYTPRLRHV